MSPGDVRASERVREVTQFGGVRLGVTLMLCRTPAVQQESYLQEPASTPQSAAGLSLPLPRDRREAVIDGVVAAAQFNETTGWLRLPLFVVVSGFLFVLLGWGVGASWLAAAILVDRVSAFLRQRVASGQRQLAFPYFWSLIAVSACWIAHALLIWSGGGEVNHIIAVIDLFMVMIYGVTGGQRSLLVISALVGPPLATFFGLMIFDLWANSDVITAICGSFATLGACIAVMLTAHSSFRASERVQLSNKALEGALVEVNARRQEAEAASNAKSEFVALISHEIRTPMTGIIGMLDVLLRSNMSPEQRDHAAIAQRSASDLQHLLDDLIDISRLDSRQITIQRLPCSPVQTIEDVVALFRPRAAEKGLALGVQIDPHAPAWVLCDSRRVRQVLTNLIGNAIKFTDAGQINIVVKYLAEAGETRVEVRDTGIGLKPGVEEMVFAPFYQADSSRARAHGGAGLGLAICRQLVTLMGGRIGVDSTFGKGSVFWFTIATPIAEAPAAAEPQDADNERQACVLRILVAEDNHATQRILKALLEGAGHVVRIVNNGRDAVAAIATDGFDVVIMDVMMPEMDGPAAARRIRELGGHAGGVPIIGLTANALAGDRDRYIAAGMTDCLTKPIDIPALFTALARVSASATALS